jgi:hypothetical protein
MRVRACRQDYAEVVPPLLPIVGPGDQKGKNAAAGARSTTRTQLAGAR